METYIKEVEVLPAIHYLMCECGGTMIIGNTVLTTNPVKFTYKCDMCDNATTSTQRYPFVAHREVDNE